MDEGMTPGKGAQKAGAGSNSLPTEESAASRRSDFQPAYFGSSYNVCGTDDENSDEDCGYKHEPKGLSGKSSELLLETLEKIDDE